MPGAVLFSSSGVRPFSDDGNSPSGYDLPPSVGCLYLLLPNRFYGNSNVNRVLTVLCSFQDDPLLPPTFDPYVVRALTVALSLSSSLLQILRSVTTS